MYKLFFGNVEPYYDEKTFRDGYNKVCTYRKKKIDSFKFQEDKARSLTAGLLFEEACKAYGLEMLLVKLADDEKGKPYFDCEDSLFPGGVRMYFNISHSNNYVMVGISDGPIGVDIQYIEPLKEDIASRFFHPDEQELFYKASDEEYLPLFYKIWCLKESYVKFKGTGLSEGLETFSVINHMQDCGVWHDDYIYAVTTTDYKLLDEAAKAEEEAAKAEIHQLKKEIIDVVKNGGDSKEPAREKLVGKVVSSTVIKKSSTDEKIAPVSVAANEQVTSNDNKAAADSSVCEKENKAAETTDSSETKATAQMNIISTLPDKKCSMYQNMMAAEKDTESCMRAVKAKQKMNFRYGTKYARLK